jgi:pyruvyl transferase EpsO
MTGRSNLTVFARDERSRGVLARDLNVSAPVVPDAAVGLGPLMRHEPDRDIVWVVRRDQEALHRWPRGADGWSRHAKSPTASPRARVWRGCENLSRGRVVITDRLHGHILCLLLGIPHVVLDNSYGKISAFIETWTRDSALVRLAADPHDAEEQARRLVREAV